jgi:hypothetical protein
MNPIVFAIVPHLQHPGDWLLKPCQGAPYGLRYGKLEYAVHYAEWAARDLERAEIGVYKRDGTLQESRVPERASEPDGLGACS